MDVHEKLVELLLQEDGVCEPSDCKYCGVKGSCGYYRIADRLIANGVTVQEWIPVTERLPEDSDNVLVCHKNGLVTTNAWLGAHWWFKNERNPITHWMPLPQPPKGE